MKYLCDCKVSSIAPSGKGRRDLTTKPILPNALESSGPEALKKTRRSGSHAARPEACLRHDELEQFIRFIGYIGLANFKLIKKMEFWVPWTAGPSSWVRLFRILAGEASGLRSISLSWGTSYENERMAWRRGLGDNLDFVRALGEIKGLEELVIQGYYAKNWPAYLEKKMGLRVRAICAHCSELPANDKELADRIRKRNVGEMQRFREFQRGTEDLFP